MQDNHTFRKEKSYHNYTYNQASHYAQYNKANATLAAKRTAILSTSNKQKAKRDRALKARAPMAVLFGFVICMLCHFIDGPSPSALLMGKSSDSSSSTNLDSDNADVSLMQMSAKIRQQPHLQTLHILKLCADACVIAFVILAAQNMMARLPQPVLEKVPLPDDV